MLNNELDISLMAMSLEERKFLNINKVKDIKKLELPKIDLDPDKVKHSIVKFRDFIYTKDYEMLADNSISIITAIRRLILVGGSFSISPLLAIPVYIADKIIENKVNDKKIDKTISKYVKERDKLDKKIKETEDEEVKKNLKLLRTEIDDGISNLTKYRDIIEEPTKKRKKRVGDDNDDEFGDDFDMDFDDSFDESYQNEFSFIDMYILAENLIEDDEVLDDDNSDIEKLIDYVEYFNRVNIPDTILSEGKVTNKLRSTIRRGTAKTTLKVRKTATSTAKTTKVAGDAIDKPVDAVANVIKKEVAGKNREEIVRGKHFKLSRIIRNYLIGVTGFAIAPALTAVSVLTLIALRGNIKRKEKTKILREMKLELEIVEEKIRDADSNGDKKKKYELMRLRNALKTDIQKIRYGIEDGAKFEEE